MRWDTVNTPNSDPGKKDVLNPYIDDNFTGSEIRDLSVGSNGTTLIAAVTVDARYIDPAAPRRPGDMLCMQYCGHLMVYFSLSASYCQ